MWLTFKDRENQMDFMLPLSSQPLIRKRKKKRKEDEIIYSSRKLISLPSFPQQAKVLKKSHSFALHFPSLCRQSCSCNGTGENMAFFGSSFTCLSMYPGHQPSISYTDLLHISSCSSLSLISETAITHFGPSASFLLNLARLFHHPFP